MTFRFRPALALCALIGFSVLVSLGLWQLRRLAWKEALIARTEARLASAPIALEEALARAAAGEDMEYQPVRARGTYAHDLSLRVFGTLDGVPGAYVFTPLRTDGARGAPFIFVNRGFAPQSLAEGDLSQGAVEGEILVEGLLRAPERRAGGPFAFLAPEDQPEDGLYFRRDPAILAAAAGIAAAPHYIDGSGRETRAPWPRGGTTRLAFANRHLEYALTWFGLAAALAGVYLAFSLRR